MAQQSPSVPGAFFIRKLHSLMGFWLVLFLCEHLLTNSQAALFFSDHGNGFVRMVNALQELPYLHVIEIVLIGAPLLIHALWGFLRLRSAKYNSWPSNGTKPSLWKYSQNRAYTWQRITSWMLLVGIVGHVVQMRFVDYPVKGMQKGHEKYIVRLNMDGGLYALAADFNANLYDAKKVEEERQNFHPQVFTFQVGKDSEYNEHTYQEIKEEELFKHEQEWVNLLSKQQLKQSEVLAVTDSFGAATLLSVRDTFKQPTFAVVYSIFVVSAVFHAANGLWTCLIAWGITISQRSQDISRKFCLSLMIILTCLGLLPIWGIYFNLG